MKTFFFIFLYIQASCCHISKGQRIIGGDVARAGQFPFVAAIYKHSADGLYFCGGALLTTQWIITAAQCVDGAILFDIYLGANNIKSPESTSIRLATEKYVKHPDFNPLTLEHDVGLIKLRMPVQITDYIQKIYTLPSSDLPANAGALQVMGWGQTSDETDIVDELNWVDITTLSNEECRLTYGNQISDGMVCVAGSFNEGACLGDTGSPLIEFVRGYYSMHVGISSFVSSNGCESTDPSGYTRTYPYLPWIRNVTRNENFAVK